MLKVFVILLPLTFEIRHQGGVRLHNRLRIDQQCVTANRPRQLRPSGWRDHPELRTLVDDLDRLTLERAIQHLKKILPHYSRSHHKSSVQHKTYAVNINMYISNPHPPTVGLYDNGTYGISSTTSDSHA